MACRSFVCWWNYEGWRGFKIECSTILWLSTVEYILKRCLKTIVVLERGTIWLRDFDLHRFIV